MIQKEKQLSENPQREIQLNLLPRDTSFISDLFNYLGSRVTEVSYPAMCEKDLSGSAMPALLQKRDH